LCPATPNGCRDTHPTWRVKLGEAFQWGLGGWEAIACTLSRQLVAVTNRVIQLPGSIVEAVLISVVQ